MNPPPAAAGIELSGELHAQGPSIFHELAILAAAEAPAVPSPLGFRTRSFCSIWLLDAHTLRLLKDRSPEALHLLLVGFRAQLLRRLTWVPGMMDAEHGRINRAFDAVIAD